MRRLLAEVNRKAGTNKKVEHKNPFIDRVEAGFEDYGFKKNFHIDKSVHRRVLVTGTGSYVGESFRKWVKIHYPDNFTTDAVDMTKAEWKNVNFSGYDAVFHVAGIAHADVEKASDETKQKYYEINTELAVETAKKCMSEGVKQFIFMSSMIVYGESAPYGKKKIIDEYTVPAPANFYGDSKWQADRRIREMDSDIFHVAVIRSPMIYGKNSKGNYLSLARMAKVLPFFPKVKNYRSMIHIDNLCEFLSLLILSGENGIYFPQNREYTSTSFMVKEIGRLSGRQVRLLKALNPAVKMCSFIPGRIGRLANKAFGNNIYAQNISQYNGMEYIVRDLKESIRLTEGGEYS